eukprot:6311994-Alexandrium_andersonii.AAC.1
MGATALDRAGTWPLDSCPTALGEPATWPPEGPAPADLEMAPDGDAMAEMARGRSLDLRKKP